MALPSRRSRRQPARYWDPFSAFPGFDDLFERMNQMLTRAFPDVARISIESWSPPVDLEETDDAFRIEADLPGVEPGNINVDVDGREVRISGESGMATQPGEAEGQQMQRSSRFSYRLTLPSEVNSEEASATFEHGCLRLTLPKVSTGRRRRISVQSGAATQIEPGVGAPGSKETVAETIVDSTP